MEITGKMNNSLKRRRAIFVYEATRLHAIELGCPVLPSVWEGREEEFRNQFVELVDDLCSGKRKFPNFREVHNSWMKKYVEMGWKYGKEYNPEKKTHPDLVPYEKLDPKEKVKDEVFLRLVEIAKYCIW